MPVRTKEYKWQLAYSTVVHGTSLKTLYRNMAGLDNPVMLVVKDMQNKVGLSSRSTSKTAGHHPNRFVQPIVYFAVILDAIVVHLPPLFNYDFYFDA